MVERPKPRDKNEYGGNIHAHLPPGELFPDDSESNHQKFLASLGVGMAHADQRAVNLLDELLESKTLELVKEHEIDYGIIPDDTKTIEERRALLSSKKLQTGSQLKQYFVDVAESLWFAIAIEENRPAWVGIMQVGDKVGEQYIIFTLTIYIDKLIPTANFEELKKEFAKIKPGHMTIYWIPQWAGFVPRGLDAQQFDNLQFG